MISMRLKKSPPRSRDIRCNERIRRRPACFTDSQDIQPSDLFSPSRSNDALSCSRRQAESAIAASAIATDSRLRSQASVRILSSMTRPGTRPPRRPLSPSEPW